MGTVILWVFIAVVLLLMATDHNVDWNEVDREMEEHREREEEGQN